MTRFNIVKRTTFLKCGMVDPDPAILFHSLRGAGDLGPGI